jgi:hypothetical protein
MELEKRLFMRAMATAFVYRCPNTGLNVQGFIADDPAPAGYYPVTCLACTRLHLVDPKTFKVAASERKQDSSRPGPAL